MSDTDFEYRWGQRHAILHRAEISTLYHQKRERFFGAAERWTNFVSIVGGSAAFVAVAGSNDLAVKIAGAVVALSSASALIWQFGERARQHALLVQAFKRIEVDILSVPERAFTDEQLAAWGAAIRSAELSEPPAHSALVRICQNELAVAAAHPERVVRLRWHERWFAHFFDFPHSGSARQA